ncbi:hypothetical protein [Arthrobacter sp. ISL-28]|uniref:hypothetical protein n=1 Tax=Arthrobacter sp. ISL-28 TaxID=2819108 RepID=UPI001BE812E0|nr:hypothetical protein [Arthrobacter sp. ISL-28]MBT2523478.1 hypothetical protein [Arthrobacter sp. ISL-28]
MDEMRLKLIEGQIGLPRIGAVRQNATGLLPYAVVDEAEREIGVFSVFLSDLVLTDMSPLTVRSYGNDLLRWWRVLQLIGVPWDEAGRVEVEVLVGWMRSAVNPQRTKERGRKDIIRTSDVLQQPQTPFSTSNTSNRTRSTAVTSSQPATAA